MLNRTSALQVAIGTLLTLSFGLATAQDLTYTFEKGTLAGPETIAVNGFQNILFINGSGEEADVQFTRLHEGVTLEDYKVANDALNEAFSSDEENVTQLLGEMLVMADVIGGIHLAPHTQGSAYLKLEPGTYAVGASTGGGPGDPSEEVDIEVAVTAGETAEAPTADFSLHLMDFHFDFPETMPAGEQLWEVSATGSQPHMALVFKLNEGKTAEDVTAWMADFAGEPPVNFEGGALIEAITAGQTFYTSVNLTPGTYVAVCPLPNLATGEPHFVDGMVSTFTVQ